MDNAFQHHGILGMKWGKRNGPPYPLDSGGKSSSKRKGGEENHEAKKTEEHSKSKNLQDLTDDELRARINRLEMEKRYRDLSKTSEVKKTSRGKAFVMDVLEKSGKNIASQATTYIMGTVVNKAFRDKFGEDIVNPKKGQKDK